MDFLTLAWIAVIDLYIITATMIYWIEDEVDELGREKPMTLAEFLTERTRKNTPLMIFNGDEYGNYGAPIGRDGYGAESVKYFKQREYAKEWMTYRVKHISNFFTADNALGYMIWIRRPDWDDALAEERTNG